MKISVIIFLISSFWIVSFRQLKESFPKPDLPFLGSVFRSENETESTPPPSEKSRAIEPETVEVWQDTASRIEKQRQSDSHFPNAKDLKIGTPERILFRLLGPPHASVDKGNRTLHMYHGVMLTVENGKIASMPENFRGALQQGVEKEMLADISRDQREKTEKSARRFDRPSANHRQVNAQNNEQEQRVPTEGSLRERRNMLEDILDDIVRSK